MEDPRGSEDDSEPIRPGSKRRCVDPAAALASPPPVL